METQIKLFNKAYVESQVRQVKEVRHKELRFTIEESDRAFSRTLYVSFWYCSIDKTWLKGCTLRISDHLLQNDVHTTFLVKPLNWLDKKTKQKFMRALELVASNTIKKSVRKNLDRLLKRFVNESEDI